MPEERMDAALTPSAEDLGRLSQLLNYTTSQLVYVAAKLGIADLLMAGPQDCAELATRTETHAPSLYRVLRALAAVGVFSEVAPQRFALTPLAAGLRSDVPGSLRAFAMLNGEAPYRAFGDLLYSVRTGEPAFEHVYGTAYFRYMVEHPEFAATFNAAMTGRAVPENAGVVAAYDFAGVGTLVDIGGGHGSLLAAVLRAHPALRGVLFDRPDVVAGAHDALAAAGVADRCEVVGGDFFAAVPPGGDTYLLQRVLHDWDDARATAILASCRAAMGSGARVLVVEAVVPPGDVPAQSKLTDITMLVMLGGQERTEAEFRALFAATGFALTRVIPTAPAVELARLGGVAILEGVPVERGA